MSISVAPLPLIYGFVRILVLWAPLLGSLCSQFLQLLAASPRAHAHQTSLPRALLRRMQTELADSKIMPKSLMRAASAVLIWECWCVGGGPTAAPGSPSCNTAAAFHSTLSLAATSRASKSAPKVGGNAAFHSSEWMIKPWHGEGKVGGKKNLKKKQRNWLGGY